MFSDLELMEQHAKVLFKHDMENRITVVNEPPFDEAPLIYVGVTKNGKVLRYSNTIKKDLIEKINALIQINSSFNLGEIINVLHKEQQFNDLSVGPAYVFPKIKNGIHSRTVQVTYENKELLKPFFPYTFEDFELKQPCFVIIENNRPVSICCSARKTELADEASVFTHPDYRGRGYSLEVTTAWAAEVQKQGRLALYSTSWDNFASQAVAKKLKLHQYGTDIQMS